MKINDILKLKFPNASFLKDIILQDDGKGSYIKEWNLKTPEPTKEDLNGWAIDFDLQYRQELARQARVYPTIEQQLDMQYHDAIATDGVTTRWIDAVEAVKLAHPIPEE